MHGGGGMRRSMAAVLRKGRSFVALSRVPAPEMSKPVQRIIGNAEIQTTWEQKKTNR
jgi:hypothetical protein